MSITLNAAPLFNISDQVARKINNIGLLLGQEGTIITSFELKLDEAIIDLDFFDTRFDQYKTINNELEIVGLYQIDSKIEADSLTISYISQLIRHGGSKLAKMKMVLLVSPGIDKFRGFAIDEIGNIQKELDIHICLTEVEQNVSSTITKHSKYYNSNSYSKLLTSGMIDQNIIEHNKSIEYSINQIISKISSILEYIESHNVLQPGQDLQEFIAIQNSISHLSTKIQSDSERKNDDEYRLLVISKLSILNSQAAALDKLREKVSKQMMKIGLLSQHYSTHEAISGNDRDIIH